MPREKVGMEMRQENIFDFAANRSRVSDVLLDITLRIDHDRRVRFLVSDEAGSVRETAEIVLLELHDWDSVGFV
jgi:hypothetical protein